jgi:oxygen-independent coproporphyrinogen-3 oxidase
LKTAHTPAVLATCHELQYHDIIGEFMLNALRLKQGVSVDTFVNNTGLTWEELHPRLQSAWDRGWIIPDNQRIATTTQGWQFLNDVLELFI